SPAHLPEDRGAPAGPPELPRRGTAQALGLRAADGGPVPRPRLRARCPGVRMVPVSNPTPEAEGFHARVDVHTPAVAARLAGGRNRPGSRGPRQRAPGQRAESRASGVFGLLPLLSF